MNRKLINWIGLTGVIAFLSYTAAVLFSPLAYPGYNWMAQAVSDLSAEMAPSRTLWNQLAAIYGKCSILSATCVSIFVQDTKVSTRLFRIGIHLFSTMNWVSSIGYSMFPLADSGMEIASLQEVMHVVVTALVVLLSIVSLILLIIAGCRNPEVRHIGIVAALAFFMMLVGAVGQGLVSHAYFGVVERFSVFSAVGFNAVLGWQLFRGFPGISREEA